MINFGELFIQRPPRRRTALTTVPGVYSFEKLEERIALAGTPIAADFSSAQSDFAMTQIKVNGVNLLQGSGFHIIGHVDSAGVAGDNLYNVASESRYNSNGIMRSYNGSQLGGTVPYSLKFTKDSADASKIAFTVSVGKSSSNFPVMNIPMEANMGHFSYWRHSGSTTPRRYDQNPFSYSTESGSFYIEHAPGTPTWGEMIGPKYTLRVTITGSNSPVALAFVNAPGLGGGIRDVEFGFSGGLPAQSKRTLSGYIQVFQTDSSIIPGYVMQSETSTHHQIGRRESDGWSVNVTDRPQNYLQFGPYVDVSAFGGVARNSTNIAAGSRTAVFRLMVDNNKADNNRLLTIDIYDAATGKQIKKMDISRRMFTSANKYQEFSLEFDAKPGQRLEFRTYWWGGSYVKQDSLKLL